MFALIKACLLSFQCKLVSDAVEVCEPYLLSFQCKLVSDAVEVCVSLNQWKKAVEIAKEHNISNAHGMLAKYASHLLDKGIYTIVIPAQVEGDAA